MKNISLAVISPYDKRNLTPFIKKLVEINSNTEFVATTGSFNALKDEITNIKLVETFTGFKESPEGLVKTLHPKIFFGYLGDEKKEEHSLAFKEMGIKPIDLLVCNLYPFWEIKEKKLSIQDLTYYWDIGGPSMIMAAVKGYHTIVLTDPDDYNLFLDAIIDENSSSKQFYKRMNLKALKYVVNYHKMIGEYFDENINLL